MQISIDIPAANRATVSIGDRDYYFSYHTCVALRKGAQRFRRDHTYSRTTARHMSQMGVKDWPQVDDATFEREAEV